MAEAQLLVSEDEFTCLLCLETLSDPVTILCGHSFCLKCLSDYWDQSQECSCPQCRHTFIPRPALHRNTLLNELVKKLKKPRLSPHPSQNYSCPGDVQCDACTGEKSRALKSCLTCMASFCQTHLQPHFEVAAWKDHKLTDPVRNLKEKLCVKHHKSLEIFLTELTEQVLLGLIGNTCIMCTYAIIMSSLTAYSTLFVFLMTFLGHVVSKDQVRMDLLIGSCYLFMLSFAPSPVTHSQMSSLVFYSLLSDFCSLTLDINTAHRDLRLSERNKKVTLERKKTKYPDHPDRFDCWWQVLCREALTGTRCYWEVECSGDNMEIGVAYKRLGRKGDGSECGLGINDKSWSLWCFNSKYFVCHNSQQIFINAPYSPRIGVYLDWPAGSLSFYSVSHTMTLLHRFNTSFTEPLYPGFWLDYKISFKSEDTGYILSH
uniref:Tripartite motif-containing protein 16-like n=1 Tax=Erpetoichthys calabaricus TaxID=27687 RepID=A0A8C4TJS2_ERPCA